MIWRDLKATKNTTKSYELRFTKDGVRLDITDWIVYFTVKEAIIDTDVNAKISKKITSHISPITGITTIDLSSGDLDLTAGNYYYSMDYKDDTNNQGILFRGRFLIEEPVRQERD